MSQKEGTGMGDLRRPSPHERRAFAERLQTAIEMSGLTYEEIALRARKQLPSAMKLSAAGIWQYAHGKTFPRQKHYIDAICHVLGVPPGDLIAKQERVNGPGQETTPRPAQSSVSVEDLGNGHAKLKIMIDVPWDKALKVLNILTNE
jgi:transcriptional regulator with XRE-family HTH domain